jgi:drug/metabolite transporter (DMT)-like permease
LVSMLISAVLSIPGMIGHYVPPTSTTWWLLLATTICGLVTQLLMTHGYRLARASTASAMTLITPLFAAVASLALLGEALPAGTWLGGTLILGAGILHFTGATLPAIK